MTLKRAGDKIKNTGLSSMPKRKHYGEVKDDFSDHWGNWADIATAPGRSKLGAPCCHQVGLAAASCHGTETPRAFE